MAAPRHPTLTAVAWNILTTLAAIAILLVSLGFWTWMGIGILPTLAISTLTCLALIAGLLHLHDRLFP
jgi:hypothetical protein